MEVLLMILELTDFVDSSYCLEHATNRRAEA